MKVLFPGLALAAFLILVAWRRLNARRQKRVLGVQRYRDGLETAGLLARFSGRVETLEGAAWISVAAGLVLLALPYLRGSSWLLGALGLVLFVTGLGPWARKGVPPSVLFLGSSAAQQISVQASIRAALFPFRPVSLLQTGRLSDDVRIPGDCYRVDREIDWREAVAALCRSVAVIVLDARTLTEFVEEEIRHLAEAGHPYKALIIGSVEVQVGAPAACVPDPESAIALLRHLFLEAETLPTPEVPMSELAQEWGEANAGSV